MTNRRHALSVADALVVKDGAGAFYAIPLALVEQLRVPEERRAALDALFEDDTKGYSEGWEVRSGVNLGLGVLMERTDETVTVSLTSWLAESPRESITDDSVESLTAADAEEPAFLVILDERQQLFAIPFDLVRRMRVLDQRADAVRSALASERATARRQRFTGTVVRRADIDRAAAAGDSG